MPTLPTSIRGVRGASARRLCQIFRRPHADEPSVTLTDPQPRPPPQPIFLNRSLNYVQASRAVKHRPPDAGASASPHADPDRISFVSSQAVSFTRDANRFTSRARLL